MIDAMGLVGGTAEAPVVDQGPGHGAPDALVLDIGGDVGALILYADDALVGAEIDLTPEGVAGHPATHTAIRRRRATAQDVVCGVYPHLTAGRYTVWGLDHRPVAVVDIIGGRVGELDLTGGRLGP